MRVILQMVRPQLHITDVHAWHTISMRQMYSQESQDDTEMLAWAVATLHHPALND